LGPLFDLAKVKSTPEPLHRCGWCGTAPLYVAYHDEEWGVPVHDDRHLFEMLNLEGAQAGLSWWTILQKRDHYRHVFHDFHPEVCAQLTDDALEAALLDPGIVRNRLKVFGVRENARAFLKVQAEFGSFDSYIWRFVGGQPIVNRWEDYRKAPATTPESDAMSKDLKKRGFKFIGSTICYAFMQAVGMVNDHEVACWRH
jgi:DNA-3-methyladenine glycosylase I